MFTLKYRHTALGMGRYGEIKTAGLTIDTEDRQVNLRPMTSKGQVGVGHLAIPQDPDVLFALAEHLQQLAVQYDDLEPRFSELLNSEQMAVRFHRLLNEHETPQHGRSAVKLTIQEEDSRAQIGIIDLKPQLRADFDMINAFGRMIEVIIEIPQDGSTLRKAEDLAAHFVALLQTINAVPASAATQVA